MQTIDIFTLESMSAIESSQVLSNDDLLVLYRVNISFLQYFFLYFSLVQLIDLQKIDLVNIKVKK